MRIRVDGFRGRVLDPHICYGSAAGIAGSDFTDFYNSPDYTPVVPDTSNLDLPGQFDSMPGGYSTPGGFYSADPSGANVIYTDPSANPNPTGGWQTVASQVLSLAAQGARTYAAGSPTTAIPPARKPLHTSSLLTTPTGQTNWLIVGGAVVLGVGVMLAIGLL
jgi:hypothetical protein